MSSDPFATPPTEPEGNSSGTNTLVIIVIVMGVLLMMALVCGGILLALLLPAVSAARSAARDMQTSNNLKQVGLAIHNYHSVYRQLPAAAGTDAAGNPIWSWRVALLPFVEQNVTWEQWQKDQAWNSQANLPLCLPLPFAYANPKEADPSSDQTHVFAIRHPQSMMSGESTLTFDSVTDGLSNTMLAVYLPWRTTSWAAPEDISLAELQAEFAKATPAETIQVLFGDGAVLRFSDPLDAETIEAMVTRDGGELVNL